MTLRLQRKLLGDAAKWRTLGKVSPDDIDAVFKTSDSLARMLNDLTEMRLMSDDSTEHLANWKWGTGWTLECSPSN